MGPAIDIGAVDGERCDARRTDPRGACFQLALELYTLSGCLRPTELIYYWIAYPNGAAYGQSVLNQHTDHIHAGYDEPRGQANVGERCRV